MRTCILIILAALVAAPAAAASELVAPVPSDVAEREVAASGGDSLALENGRGIAVVVSREGSILGSVGRGRVRIADIRRGPRTSVDTGGCKTRKQVNSRTVVCIGRNLKFHALGGAWRVVLVGSGINASAKLKGHVTLRGRSGTYSIRYGDDRPWPRRARTFRLG